MRKRHVIWERFPTITGRENAGELVQLTKRLRAWRRGALYRMYGGLSIAVLVSVVFGGVRSWISVLLVGIAVITVHTLIDARLLSFTGAKGMALVYRMVAGCTGIMLVVGAVWWITTLINGFS